MNALRRQLLKLTALLGGVTLLWACNAPFIPVPPPGALFDSQLVDDGMGGQKEVWITTGLPSSNAAFARYSVLNERTGMGIIVTAGPDGTFTGAPLDGVMNDRINIWYVTPQADQSDSICLLLTEAVDPLTGSAPRCSP